MVTLWMLASQSHPQHRIGILSSCLRPRLKSINPFRGLRGETTIRVNRSLYRLL
jgi:hypothetical protein